MDDSDLEEFKAEALEMFDQAEKCLLKIEQGAQLSSVYNDIFRVFHSVKGGAGMFGITDLQNLIHEVESNFQNLKSEKTLGPEQISYFIKGIDLARGHFEGKKITAPPVFPSVQVKSQTEKTVVKEQASLTQKKVTSQNAGELIYIIDDEPSILEILEDIVGTKNYLIKTFSSSKEALDQIEKDRPLVVITDYKMPHFTGSDVLKFTRKKLPNTQVIFLSGLLDKTALIESISMGLFAAVEKPFNPTQILPLVDQAIEKFRLHKIVIDALNFIFYQYSDLKAYLHAKGDQTLSEIMEEQLQNLLAAKKKINKL